MRPGPRLAPALGALAVLALLAPWVPLLGPVLGGTAVLLLGLTALDAWRVSRPALEVSRPEVLALSLAEAESLPLHLTHDAGIPLQVEVRCRWPALLGGGASRAAGTVEPGRRLVLDFQVQGVARGSEALPPVTVALRHWGLAERLAELPAPCRVKVLPNLRAVRRLRHQLDAFFLRRAGTRVAPRTGQGREFDRLREYVAGDDFRNLAWKSSARRGKLIVRESRVERSQDVLFCVDRGHRMAARVGDLTRNDHAVNAAVLTAYLCNRLEDRTGLLAFAAEVEQGVGQGRGASHLAAVTRFATAVAPEYLHTDYGSLAAHLRRRLKSRTLILLLTVLPEQGEQGSLLQAVRMLIPRHLPFILVLQDPALDALAATLPRDKAELSRTLVAADLVDARRRLIQDLRVLGALVAETPPEDAGVNAVNAYLDVKRRQLL